MNEATEGMARTRLDRTESDILSGTEVSRNYERHPNFSTEEMDRHFELFQEYDIDKSGFITPDNLMAVLAAMEVSLSEEQVKLMIEEVAVLSGHDNDGKLSFRDYMGCIAYDKSADAHNHMVEANEELRLSIGEAAAESGERAAEEQPPPARMRRTSFSVMNSLAKSRINTFEQAVEMKIKMEAPAKIESKFAGKLAKFKRIENPVAGPSINNEELQKSALKTKLMAFEQASKAEPVAFKKSWKNVQPGRWKAKTQIAGGVLCMT